MSKIIDKLKKQTTVLYSCEENRFDEYQKLLADLEELRPYVRMAEIFLEFVSDTDEPIQNCIYCLDEEEEQEVTNLAQQIRSKQ